uniref:NB-ARC domain-containing protein n=1 Tax=Oryza punctata TaxID=4537 RepID=A0A0E0LGE9_ORYPU
MDAFFSAILGEVASRSLSFLIDRCSSKTLPPSEEKIQKRLERMLLRLEAVVEVAEGRCITNHAMIRQLNMLRQDMHRGYYLLDTFRNLKSHDEEEIMTEDNHEVSYTLALSKFNFAKRPRIPTASRRQRERREFDQIVENIEIAMTDMVEFVLLLNNYPSMHRQPYNTYMFMDKCMFGRQMEMEYVIKFLLHLESPSTDNVGILPIIGPAKVGKSTFVEHVCYDERVRNHFSRIIFVSDNDFRVEKSLLNLTNKGVVKHKHSSSSSGSNGEERLLVVVELTGDVTNGEWKMMCSSSQSCISAGSKIIITSRSEKIAKLGTTLPLRLKFLSREAYWYFFKVLAFGSLDPEEHPKITSLSMEMFNGYFDHELSKSFIGPFIDLNNIANFIQATLYDGNWLSLRERVRNHFALRNRLKSLCAFIPKMDGTGRYYCEIYDHCRVGHVHEEDHEAPKIDMQDILSGRVGPHGRFDVLLWRSHLPPYYSYIYSCEIHEYKPPQPLSPLPSKEKIHRLQRTLLRLAACTEEAEGRRITNHSLLCQISMLRQYMHRGYYVLDTFRFKKAYEEEMNGYDDDKVSSNTLALSKFNPRKRARVPTGSSRHGVKGGGELE